MSVKMNQIKSNKIWVILATVILFCLPLLRIHIGVDITDTGYSLGNFENFSSMEGMWVLATYLANVIGHFFTLLPFGHTMLGMNFYTGLVVSVILVFSFLFLRKVISSWIVFIGELLAFFLCWCPTAILYNYLTYVFMTLALYFIYQGIVKNKNGFLVIAGAFLGMNVFVRFPNLVEMGFILIVWYDAIYQKKGWKKGIADTLFCLGGYIAGMATLFVVVLSRYGWLQYKDMLISLTNVGSQISGYGPLSMVKKISLDYIQHLRWIWMAVLCIFLVQFIYSKLKNKILQGITCVIGGSAFAGIFVYYYKKGLFSYNRYNDYTSIFFWAILFLVISIAVDVVLLIRKDVKREIKILAITSLMILALTPLGSNNSVYPNFNNLFFVAPVTFYGIYQFILRKNLRKKRFPLQVAVFAVLAIIIIQSCMFKVVFTFRDVGLSKALNTTFTNNEVLRGMRTTKARVEMIENLSAYIDEQNLQNRQVVIFGYAPAIPYMLQLKPAITSTWPDLPSYSNEEFVCSLRQAQEPLVMILTGGYPDILAYKDSTENEKAAIMAKYLFIQKYEVIYKDSFFEIYDMQ